VSWLKDVQNNDGGWRSGLKGPSLSIYTGVVLAAFKMIGIPGSDPSVKRGIAWIKEAQNPDGGWGMPKGGKSLSLGTSWVLVALASYGERHLADVQRPNGVFVSNTPKEFKKKKKANTQTTCFVIWALKAAGY
jgi:prenyltransferase beta subunit